MIKSMTGYGRREKTWKSGTVAVELRSVNHRFCEVVVRLPKTLSALEEDLKRAIMRRILRGRVDVAVSVQGQRGGMKTFVVDHSLAKQYCRALRDLQRKLELPGTVDVSMLAGARDILTLAEEPLGEDPRLKRTISHLLTGALTDLEAMRRREGTALDGDMKKRLHAITAAKGQIERRIPQALEEYRARMQARVEKLLGDHNPDISRLHQELALFAERCDVTEELVRLGSHLTQFASALKRREAVGRTLDFLLQEMGREVNTIGSKANDADIAIHVVKIKGELEKIREQVQNIE